MKRYLVISIAFHSFVLMALTLGFLTWERKDVDLYQAIPVEVVDYADKAQSPNPQPDSLKLEEPEKEIKDPVPVEPLKEEVKEPEPEVKEPEPEVIPEPEPVAEPIKEEPKKIEKPKVEPKPKEKPKPKDKPKEKKKEQPQDVMSILKNLQTQNKAAGSSKSGNVSANPGQGGELGDKVTASELDRVRKQIESAWKIPAGAQGVHKVKVAIHIVISADRTVVSAKLADPHKMGDVAYRTLAESALHAVLSFKNRPLLLPPEKYQVWKEITMYFDPTNVL